MTNAELQSRADAFAAASEGFGVAMRAVIKPEESKVDPRLGLCISQASIKLQEANMWVNTIFASFNQHTEDNIETATQEGLKKAGFTPEVVK